MGCGTSFVKYVLFFFNLFVALVGLAMVGVGVAVLLKWTVMTELINNHLNVAPWVFIVIGAIVFVIAFFGCCGAIRESHCMIVSYAIFLLVIIIAEVVLGVLLFTYSDNIRDGLVKGVAKVFDESTRDASSATIYHNLEQQLECCGKNGPGDYGGIGNLGGAFGLPQSCCTRTGAVGEVLKTCSLVEANNEGCIGKVAEIFNKWNKPIASIAIAVACIEVVGAVFALCLANSIRNMDRRSRY